MFGAPVQRREDPRLVSGNGRYLDDLGQDALAAAFVRSPFAHARILDIDVTDAIDIPGVIAIYTHEDLDGNTTERLPLLIPHPDLTNPMTGYCLSREVVKHVGDAASAIASSPHQLTLSLQIERSASMPMEGRGVYARWDSDEQSIRLYSSTQTSTGVRAAVAAKLGMPLAKVECIAPDVGGGFGVKIVHPWPE